MKIIAALAFLALAQAHAVKIAPPFKPDSLKLANPPKFIDPRDLKDIPEANPTDLNVPILRFNVPEAPVVANSNEKAAPQYQSPVDIGMLFVPEEVMRAVAAANAENAQPAPESEDFSSVRVVDSPLDDEQVPSVLAPSELEAIRISDVAKEIPQVIPVAVPMPYDDFEGSAVRVIDTPMEDEQILRVAPSKDVMAEAPMMPVVPEPFDESADISADKMESPMEPEELGRVAPSELETVRVVEAPKEIPQVWPVEMAVPAPFAEPEDFSAVRVVDAPLETEPSVGDALSEAEAEQPKEYVNVAEMLSLLQDEYRPYPAYNNPMMR